MELGELPWYKEHFCIYKDKFKLNGEILKYLSKDILLNRIKKYPITRNLLSQFLEKCVDEISLMPLNGYNGKLWIDSSLFSFRIMINSNKNLEKRAESLIHECANGIYCVNTSEDVESTIEQESLKFYNSNKLFCINFFEESIK